MFTRAFRFFNEKTQIQFKMGAVVGLLLLKSKPETKTWGQPHKQLPLAPRRSVSTCLLVCLSSHSRCLALVPSTSCLPLVLFSSTKDRLLPCGRHPDARGPIQLFQIYNSIGKMVLSLPALVELSRHILYGSSWDMCHPGDQMPWTQMYVG